MVLIYATSHLWFISLNIQLSVLPVLYDGECTAPCSQTRTSFFSFRWVGFGVFCCEKEHSVVSPAGWRSLAHVWQLVYSWSGSLGKEKKCKKCVCMIAKLYPKFWKLPQGQTYCINIFTYKFYVQICMHAWLVRGNSGFTAICYVYCYILNSIYRPGLFQLSKTITRNKYITQHKIRLK